MRRFLYTSGITGATYAILASLMVTVSALFTSTLWVVAVSYVGPIVTLIILLRLNWSAFDGVRNSGLKWVLLLGSCGLMTVAIAFFVFVLATNVHLALGGRI